MSRQKKYTFIDLFAGCGGLSLGLEQAGFEVVFMNEIVETFASTYLANHSLKQGQYFIGDINELNTCLDKYRDTLKNPDRPITLVCGGPPCQGFSMANRQRIIDDPRNQLYKAYLQFLSEIRPQFFSRETFVLSRFTWPSSGRTIFCMMISFPSRAFSSSLRLASAFAEATSARSFAISVSYFCRVSRDESHAATGVAAMPIRARIISAGIRFQ